ncbi:MAG: ATP-grasp domain-containing protein [Phycisphaeraceae bacterium]|nr:ATP-grasp domain-containing protein [Phycisphaeraceae bacterium]
MRIFVFEHVTGGGLAGQPWPVDLAMQGGAMLSAVAEDMHRAGHHVTATRDLRWASNLTGMEVRELAPQAPAEQVRDTFDQLAREADVTLVIAPETDGVLSRWLRRLADAGCRGANATAEAAELCGDKMALAVQWALHGVPTPETWMLLDQGESWPWEIARTAGYPCVIKPRDGAGCERTWWCRTPDELAEAARRHGESEQRPAMVAQSACPGQAVSCSVLIGRGGKFLCPPAFQQIALDKSGRMSYHGGRMGLGRGMSERARQLAQQAVDTVDGLHGYIGVDLVLGDDPKRDQVVEINPRLTLSYLGLRGMSRDNLAPWLLGEAKESPCWDEQASASWDQAGVCGTESMARQGN